jgi:hypothetical protein
LIFLLATGSYAEVVSPVAPACGERGANAKKPHPLLIPDNQSRPKFGKMSGERLLDNVLEEFIETHFDFYRHHIDRARRHIAGDFIRAAKATAEKAFYEH